MKKKLGLGCALIFVLLLALRLGAGMWAGRKWNDYDVAWTNEVKAERQRAASVRRPMVHGQQPLDENVCPRYQKIFGPKLEDTAAISSALRTGAKAEEVAALLAAHKATLDELREAFRCCRCDWETPWEKAFSAPLPNLAAARSAASLFIIESRGLPPREASERCLDAIRLGTDFEHGALLIHKLIGCAILINGLEGLGQVVARAKPGELDLDAVAKDLERLVADRPGVGDMFRGERLGLHSFADAGQAGPLDVLGPKLLVEVGIVEMDALERELEAALLLDRAGRDKVFDEVAAKGAASWNPLTRMAMPNLKNAAKSVEDTVGAERLVATAIRLEKMRGADGTYPEKLDDLPLDPGTGAPIQYSRSADGKGWLLVSSKLKLAK